jgi:membrane protease YdiL (CAAX protease family)
MITVPLRALVVGNTVMFTAPVPVPLVEETVIQGTLLRALQAHCGSLLVIVIAAVPPVAGKD